MEVNQTGATWAWFLSPFGRDTWGLFFESRPREGLRARVKGDFIVSGFTLSVIPFSFLLPLHGLNLRGLEFGLRMMEGRRFSCFLGQQSSMPGSCHHIMSTQCSFPPPFSFTPPSHLFLIHSHLFTEHFLLGFPPEGEPSSKGYKEHTGYHSDALRVLCLL